VRADLAEPVLDGLRWAYPFRLAAHRRPPSSSVTIEVTGPDVTLHWELVSDGAATWTFAPAPGGAGIARLEATDEQAWRLLTNNHRPGHHGAVRLTGDPDITATLQRTRAIIGEPR
jgi:hypothetical protein